MTLKRNLMKSNIAGKKAKEQRQECIYYSNKAANQTPLYIVTRSIYLPGHTQQPLKEICRNHRAGLKLLGLVTSAPKHLLQRNVVRSTWGT